MSLTIQKNKLYIILIGTFILGIVVSNVTIKPNPWDVKYAEIPDKEETIISHALSKAIAQNGVSVPFSFLDKRCRIEDLEIRTLVGWDSYKIIAKYKGEVVFRAREDDFCYLEIYTYKPGEWTSVLSLTNQEEETQ